jgi:hypothetical protein
MTIPAYFNIGVACTDAHLDTPVADRAVVGEQVGPDKTVVAAYMLPAPSQSVGAAAIMAYAGLHPKISLTRSFICVISNNSSFPSAVA